MKPRIDQTGFKERRMQTNCCTDMTDLGHGDVRLGNDLKKNEVQLKYLYKTESQSTPEGSKISCNYKLMRHKRLDTLFLLGT